MADPASRHLVTPSGCVSEASLNLIRSGSGVMGASIRSAQSLTDLAEVTFETS